MTIGWIGVDWGTTHLRAWAMQGGAVVEHAHSDDGMGQLRPDQFEDALLRLIVQWLGDGPMPVLACGMVGARQGWAETPYQSVPCPALPGVAQVAAGDPRLDVHIIAGLSQAAPADVMRGEETQIAGFLALNPGWDGVICLPGTHSKWVQVSANEVISFQTFLSGELFALLGQHSVLRHSIADQGWDEPAFVEALNETMSRPERLAARLFALRAEDLLHGAAPETARARLSGLLIGAELAAARPYWLGQNLALIGAPDSARAYGAALQAQGVPVMVADPAAMTRAGLTAAWRKLKGTR